MRKWDFLATLFERSYWCSSITSSFCRKK